MPKTKYFDRLPRTTYDSTNYQRKCREIRDLYNRLRSTYTEPVVNKFFKDNYFLDPDAVLWCLRKADKRAVVIPNASLVYQQAMNPDFKL